LADQGRRWKGASELVIVSVYIFHQIAPTVPWRGPGAAQAQHHPYLVRGVMGGVGVQGGEPGAAGVELEHEVECLSTPVRTSPGCGSLSVQTFAELRIAEALPGASFGHSRDHRNVTTGPPPSDADRYREYWAYLRHIETLRFHVGGLITVVASGILGFVYQGFRGPDSLQGGVKAGILAFLAVFVLIAQGYLVSHKAAYNFYWNLIRCPLDPAIYEAKPPRPFDLLLALTSLVQAAVLASAFLTLGLCAWKGAVAGIGAVFLAAPWFLLHRPSTRIEKSATTPPRDR
jgi:hypothetical protein